MGLLRSILSERRSLEVPAVPLTNANLLAAFGGVQAATGRSVTQTSAMRYSAVYACERVRAETTASLPWKVYRRLPDGGKEPDPGHPLYTLLHDAPNPEQTAMEFRENAVGHVDLWGVAYAEIDWDPNGQVRALWQLRPDRVQEEELDGKLYYVVTLPTGERRGLPAYRVWRTRGFMGMSIISQAREAIGMGLAAEEYGARFFGNDSRPGGLLRSPNKLTPDSAAASKASWEAAHSGLSNAHRVAVLQEGLEWQSVGMLHKDAQFLELREFQVTDICRFFRVPPHKIADLTRATFSNIEHQSIEFVTDCIRPICVRAEQSAGQSLFTEAERHIYFSEHVIDGLLRGDMKSRYDAYAVGRNWGWLSVDDVRELENQNPLPEGQGKIYLVPANMMAASQVGQSQPAQEQQNQDGAARAAQGLIADVLQRAMRREEADVMRQARKTSGDALAEWLPGFYGEHVGFVERLLEPVGAALRELGVAVDVPGLAREYAESSLVELKQAIAGADGDFLDVLQARFDGWQQVRARDSAARLGRNGG